jgi:hypothetical protein
MKGGDFMTEEERKQRHKESQKRWIQKNRDKVREYQRQYQKDHAEQLRQYQIEYREKNPEAVERWKRNAIVKAYMKIKAEERNNE